MSYSFTRIIKFSKPPELARHQFMFNNSKLTVFWTYHDHLYTVYLM